MNLDGDRLRMVETQIAGRGIADPRVVAAMRAVPRHRFVPDDLVTRAYEDHPLEIGRGQTISQPYIVAFMTQALALRGGERVLEVGTGSGYQTAILREVGARVWTVERDAELAQSARSRLAGLGYGDVDYRIGDGSLGWPEQAPFDRIIVTAAAPSVPVALASQIGEGGSMVIPVGELERQELLLMQRRDGLITRRTLCAVAFVRLVGREGWENP